MSQTKAIPATAAARSLALGGAITLAQSAVAAEHGDIKKCFGVALKSKNACAAGLGTSCGGLCPAHGPIEPGCPKVAI